MSFLIGLIALALGLAFGSFANVLIFRLTRNGSNLLSPSCCVSCGERILARDNIPLFSWALLRGKCRNCGSRISVVYPLVELTTASLFVAFVNLPVSLGESVASPTFASDSAVTLALFWLACAGVALAVIDFRELRLPNPLVYSLYAVGAAAFLSASYLQGDFEPLLRALLGATSAMFLFGAIALLVPGGMGVGDVKLAGALGLYLAWFGWGSLILGLLFAFALGALFGIALVAFKWAKVRSAIAFGPWMILGAFLAIMFGNSIWNSYLQVLQRVLI